MLRDNLCDEKKLRESIIFKDETIEEYKVKIKDLNEDIQNGIQRFPRDNKEIIDVTYFELFRLNLDSIRANYSYGNEVSILENYFIQGIDALEKTKKNLGYVQIIWLISLAILLEMDKDIFLRISKIVKLGKYNDAFLDFLLVTSNIDWEQNTSAYEEENPYAKTAEIIQLATNDNLSASKRLQTYIEKEWLKGHAAYEWKNAHKRFGYYGFWSFEAAALAKIFNLNDEVLKDNNRYPYELRHYKNNMKFSLDVQSKVIGKSHVENLNTKGITSNPDLEKIIPKEFHDYVENVIVSYNTLSDENFYINFKLNEIWFTLELYKKDNKNKNLLGLLLILLLTDRAFIYQLDWKDELEDHIDAIKNYWPNKLVDLVYFDIDNDQRYYAYIPKNLDVAKIYDVDILKLESE